MTCSWGDSCGYLLHSILDLVVDDFLHILSKLDGNLDDIEDVVFDEEITKEITLLQRMLTTIARILIPYRRNIRRLKNDVQRFTKEDLSLYYDKYSRSHRRGYFFINFFKKYCGLLFVRKLYA